MPSVQKSKYSTNFLAQTKGLSLEEINALFGDEVVVHFANATEKQRHELAEKVLAEDEQREFASRRGESVTTASGLKA